MRPPIRSSADYPASGDKRVPDLETALRKCGLRDGMTISNHHHLRNGDRVAVMMLEAAARLGVKDLMWFPSASFPCHAPVIELTDAGVVHHIEGSMNGSLGDYCSRPRRVGASSIVLGAPASSRLVGESPRNHLPNRQRARYDFGSFHALKIHLSS